MAFHRLKFLPDLATGPIVPPVMNSAWVSVWRKSGFF
jgi:hypothetical protein